MGPHFHFDFGDPSVNMGTPQFTSMLIVELKESAIAISFTGVRKAHNLLLGEVSDWLEKWLSRYPNLYKHLYSMEVAI